MPGKAPLLFLILFLTPLQLLAESVYVNDILRVGVRPQPNNDIGPVSVVITGMKLEVLERSDAYLKIRTDKGVEGWIKDIYVSNKLPAQLELARLNKQHVKLLAEAAGKDELVRKTELANASLGEEVDTLKKANTDLRQQLLKAQESFKSEDSSWPIILYLILFVAMAVVMFALGVAWHRNQAMKRLGGLRV